MSERAAAYERARDRLVSEAAEAVELFGDDELERYARERAEESAKVPHPEADKEG